MLNELTPNDTFCDYYQQWVAMYKEGAVRDVTLSKYRLTCAWLQRLIPLPVSYTHLDVYKRQAWYSVSPWLAG